MYTHGLPQSDHSHSVCKSQVAQGWYCTCTMFKETGYEPQNNNIMLPPTIVVLYMLLLSCCYSYNVCIIYFRFAYLIKLVFLYQIDSPLANLPLKKGTRQVPMLLV